MGILHSSFFAPVRFSSLFVFSFQMDDSFDLLPVFMMNTGSPRRVIMLRQSQASLHFRHSNDQKSSVVSRNNLSIYYK